MVAGDRDLARRIEALDVLAADADERPVDLPARQSLGLLDRLADRMDVWSMLMTTPFLRPDAGTVPWPMIVSRPSRATSPMRAQTLLADIDADEDRFTLHVSVRLPCAPAYRKADGDATLSKMHAEREEGHQVQVEVEAVADERQQDRDDGVDQEAADEDAIVVDPIQPARTAPSTESSAARIATAEYRLSSKPTLMLRTRPARTPRRSPSRGSSTGSLVLLRLVWARLSRGGARAVTRAGQGRRLGDVRAVGSEARMIRSTSGSRPISRLRNRRT